MAAASQNLKLEAGEKLGGKYALVRRLALGGMGQVWIAHNVLTEADVALKVLRPDADDKIQAELRFRHEAKLGAMLAHRNIVRVFDFIEQDGGLILVLELLRGESLYRLIRGKKKLPAAEAVAILLPLLSALEHAHEMGVIHRDLKPANIFLAVDPDGLVTPKLLDFGIAKLPLAGVQTLDGRVLGTPRYMSPEQIRSDPKIDGRSDLFTVGVLLMEMLTGIPPFKTDSASASLAAVLELEIDPDPDIDPKLMLVIKRATAKRAYERFATAGEFAKALREATPDSDAAMAATMRRDKPPSSRKSYGDGGEHSGPIPSDDNESPESGSAPVASVLEPRSGARKKRTFVIGAVAATALVALGIALGTRTAVAPVSTAVAPPTTVASASIEHAESPVVPVESASSIPSQPSPSAPPLVHAGVKPRVPPKKKPVATTPGF